MGWMRRLVQISALAGGVASCNLLAGTRIVESPTALAVDGRGWFPITDSRTGEEFFTRQGEFVLDETGRLVTPEGFVLLGADGTNSSRLTSLRIDTTGMPALSSPASWIESFRIERDGRIVVTLSDGAEFVRAQVLLQDFLLPANLSRVMPHIYAANEPAVALGAPQVPGSNGLGKLRAGRVELEEVRWWVKGVYQKNGGVGQGALTATRLPADLGIRGAGFFVVRDPATSGLFVTRAGFFIRDGDGFLTTYSGLRVQGCIDATMRVLGDVQIDAAGAPATSDPAAVFTAFEVAREGSILVSLSDGTTFLRGRILLREVGHPERLRAEEGGLYSGVDEAGIVGPGDGVESSLGTIHQGSVELLHASRDLLEARREMEYFEQGALRRTGSATDLAISGRGFFVVRKPYEMEESVTRRGRFRIDADRFLVTPQGERVQGFANPALTEIGDVRIDDGERPPASSPDARLAAFQIDATGRVEVQLSDGTAYTRGQVLLRDFAQSYSLQALGGALYRGVLEARPNETMFAPGSRGLGHVYSGAIEVPARPQRLMLPALNGVQLLITGEPGTACAVQTRVVNRRWVTIGRLKLGATGEADFFDVSSRKRSYPAYRVVAE